MLVAVIGALPLSSKQSALRFRDTTQRCQQQSNGMLCCGGGIASRCEADGNTMPGGSRNIGIDRAATRHDKQLESRRGGKHFLCQGSHLCDADLNTLESLDHHLFRA